MQIVIIRHGQSIINDMGYKTPIYCGRYNSPLTEQGKRSAQQLQNNDYIQKIEKIYTSNLDRAIETAQLAKPNQKIEICEQLTERSLGIFEGRMIQEIKQKYPEYFEKKELMNFRFDMKIRVPGGENYTDVCQRAEQFLNSIDLTQEKTIGIFSHFSLIRCLLYITLGISEEQLYQLCIPHCNPIVIKGKEIGKFTLIEPLNIEDLSVHT